MGLGGRLALTFATLVAVTAMLVGGASYVTADRQVTSEIDQFLKERSGEIVNGQRALPQGRSDRNSRRAGANDESLVVSVEADTEVQLIDSNGAIESNSGLELPVNDSDLNLAAKDDRSQLRTVTIDGVDYRMITAHLSAGGAVQVARSLEESNSLLSILRSRLIVIAGLLAAVAAAIGWIFAARTTRPLRSLTSAVDAVADTQDFTVPVTATGHDEVGRLARGFDRMLKALDLSREQQRRLVQDAAHELRTPLTSIKANVDWLAHADSLDAATRTQTLDGVKRELAELNDVITEIIDLATDRHELSPFTSLDLAKVAEAAVERFRARSGRPVSLRATASPVVGDADSLERAITNLLSNADKYSPVGAQITVEVERGGVWVTDRGTGIPEEERTRVFDRFYRRQEHRSEPGSGLGLAIVASIVEAHGGTVEIGDADVGDHGESGARVGFRLDGNSIN